MEKSFMHLVFFTLLSFLLHQTTHRSTLIMSNANKKSKIVSEAEEIEALQEYLKQCPFASRDSRILQVALGALDNERKKIERDAKLQRKFSSESNTNNNDKASATKSAAKEQTARPVANIMPDSKNNTSYDNDDELMEWQDVPADHAHDTHASDGSLLGRRLAQAAITAMSQARVQVSSPLGALALVLHSAICSDILQFACTGIPESNTSSSGGFAPPIRELPKSQLVPDNWEQHVNDVESPHVTFRYRKNGVGTVLLRVVLNQDTGEVQVELAPSRAAKEPAPTTLTFALQDHVNLESLARALSSSNTQSTLPALHYKSLPVLLTNLCNTFDLGPVQEEVTDMDAEVAIAAEQQQRSSSSSLPYGDTTVLTGPSPARSIDTLRVPSRAPREPPRMDYDEFDAPTIKQFQPHPHRGDFDSDLRPAGIVDPNALPGSGGNLMGPNHPAFGTHPAPDLGGGGGFGMRPRFDPFGPPGGPTDIQPPPGTNDKNGKPKGRRPPPGGPGDPNPDHQRPPSDLGNNMFL
jgi:hypothetical protein